MLYEVITIFRFGAGMTTVAAGGVFVDDPIDFWLLAGEHDQSLFIEDPDMLDLLLSYNFV